MKRLNHRRLMPILLTLLLVTLSTLFLGVMMARAAPPEPTNLSPAAPQALPDLVLDEFTMVPSRPTVNEPVTITTQIRNAGTGDSPGWRVNLYINPSDQPPTSTTPELRSPAQFFTLTAGTSAEVVFSGYVFTETGCHHTVYSWADPREGIPESDETNNMRVIHLCVDPATPNVPGEDAFEPDDDCATQAESIPTDGTPQMRSFVPTTDTDYVKFSVVNSGIYTITAAGTGQDAKPNLELSDSCNFALPFGTTTRMEFTAPKSGTYYLKLTNNASSPDPNETTYQLTVQSDAQVTTGTTPIPLGISPISGTNDANTNVVITGTQFVFPTMAELCSYEDDACTQDCIQLLETSWLGAEKIVGVVPPFNLDASPPTLLTPGPYCLQLTNPGGKQGVKPNAYTVQPAAPVLNSLNPEQGYSDKPIDLHIYGFNFVSGLTLQFGSQTVNSDDVQVVNSTHLLATIPSGQAPGTYDVSASYTSIQSDTLAAAFTVLESAEDLYGTSEELWRSPVTPRANAPVELGLVVHRKGGVGPLRGLPVRFEVDGTAIATPTVELLAKNGQSSTPGVSYTPTVEGQHTIVATIDPEQAFDDATRANNVVTRVIDVQPPAADGQAPHVDSFTINGEMTPTVTTRAVTLTAEASDVGGGSVAQIRYIEFEYNQGAGLWVPVQDSQWLNYSLNHQDHAWTLTPVGGLHYIQAWAKDADGNISEYPYQRRVDYMKSSETVARNQARIYRRDLEAGESLNVQLKPQSGDPDLYIWPPDWADGRPPWVSNREGNAEDSLTFDVPVKGTYQIEVYGYTRAEYELTIQEGQLQAQAGRRLLRPGAISAVKWPRVAPAISPDDAPPRNGGGGSSRPDPTTLDSVNISQVISETVGGRHIYTITATTAPTNAARPLFYHWEATGQPPVTHTVNTTAATDVVTYTWRSAAAQEVTVTVVNAANQVNATHSISGSTEFHYIYLPLVLRQD